MHAAAVVDPGLLHNLDDERFKAVLAPKVTGAWNLHQLTAASALDFFVMFSSVASLLGAPGQGNYVAANAFLDALAHHRRARGLPALSVNWSGWSEVGLVARHGGAAEVFALRGFDSMSPDRALAMLEELLRYDLAQVAVMPVNWRQMRDTYPQIAGMPFFAEVIRKHELSTEKSGEKKNGPARIDWLSLDKTERERQLCVYLSKQLARTLGVSPDELDTSRPMNQMGIDSLMALEIKNRVEPELGVAVPIIKFLEGVSLDDIAVLLAQEMEMPSARNREQIPVSPQDGVLPQRDEAVKLLASIDELSDEEVESLLASMDSCKEPI